MQHSFVDYRLGARCRRARRRAPPTWRGRCSAARCDIWALTARRIAGLRRVSGGRRSSLRRSAGAVELFVAAERRIDPYPLEFGTATLDDGRLPAAEPVVIWDNPVYESLASPSAAFVWASAVGVGLRARRLPRPAAGGRPSAEASVPDADAAERAARDPVGGSLDADRARSRLVPRRLEERAAGTHRVRASVRAHDVQGLAERRARLAHLDHRRASADAATPTRPKTKRSSGRRSRRTTCRWCCGSKPTAWPRCASTTRRSGASARW